MVVKIYVSGISGNKEVKKRQQRVLMILDSRNVKYDLVDIAEPTNEDQKDFMQNNCTSLGATVSDTNPRHPLPPQVFNDDVYCGDYDQFDLANEIDELEKFLKLAPDDATPTITTNAEVKMGNGTLEGKEDKEEKVENGTDETEKENGETETKDEKSEESKDDKEATDDQESKDTEESKNEEDAKEVGDEEDFKAEKEINHEDSEKKEEKEEKEETEEKAAKEDNDGKEEKEKKEDKDDETETEEEDEEEESQKSEKSNKVSANGDNKSDGRESTPEES